MEKKNVFVMLSVVIAITLGISLYCIFFGNQYLITFDSNGGSEVDNKFVRVGKTVEEPDEPTREGYQFVEWQLDGTAYDFTQKVRKKFTLVAHWRKISSASELVYKVIFDSDGGTKVENQEVKVGENAKKPTDPVKEGFRFIGWFYGDAKFDFSKKISQDMNLKAHWEKTETKNPTSNKNDEKPSKPKEDESDKKDDKKPDKNDNLSTELKVGDKVKIVGSYAESSTSTKAKHRRAIGWQRVILKVYEGREYPYRVGNETGTTGFFKAESLEKID